MNTTNKTCKLSMDCKCGFFYNQMKPQNMKNLPEKIVETLLKRQAMDRDFMEQVLYHKETGHMHTTRSFQDWKDKATGQRHGWYQKYLDAALNGREGWLFLILNCHGHWVWVQAETARYEDPVGVQDAAYQFELYKFDPSWYWIAQETPSMEPLFYWECGEREPETTSDPAMPEVTTSDVSIKMEDSPVDE